MIAINGIPTLARSVVIYLTNEVWADIGQNIMVGMLSRLFIVETIKKKGSLIGIVVIYNFGRLLSTMPLYNFAGMYC